MTGQYDAFLSYTRTDDEFFGGAITSLRKFLELGVQVVTGDRGFNIFQDIDGIEFGEKWQSRLDQAISDTTFLIPVMTPLFFRSDACRDELKKFMEHERKTGRGDLILPVYFVTTPLLEQDDLRKNDSLARELSARQRYDWRLRADLPVTDPQTRTAIKELSEKIASAISRTQNVFPEVPKGERDAAFRRASEKVVRIEGRRGEGKSKKRVLWVDDRPQNNVIERRAIEGYGVDISLAVSTGEALAKLRNERFDAIISDMGRPPDARAGYTLLEALRASGELTPYFIYAGSRDPEHIREALSRGAQGSTNIGEELIANVLNSIGENHLSRGTFE